MNRYFIFLILIFFCNACTKDNQQTDELCISHNSLVDLQGQSLFRTVYPIYGIPCVNPKNPDEIVLYYAKEYTGPPFKLIKYNLRKKTYDIIYEGKFGVRPRWNKNGWILLSLWNELGNDGFNIWKIKDSGDSLTQLTTAGNCFFPEWNKTSDKFTYQIGHTSPLKYVIADENGISLDTVFVGIEDAGSWQHDSLFSFTDIYGLHLGNFNNEITEPLFEVENPTSVSGGGTDWIDDSNIIWTHLDGVYITNIKSKSTKQIKATCNARYYQYPTYSPLLNKVFFQRIDRIKTDGKKGITFGGLFMMNLDGSCEEKIEITD